MSLGLVNETYLESYGLGCNVHDSIAMSECRNREPFRDGCEGLVPTPDRCQKTTQSLDPLYWCDVPWCYVQPDCTLYHTVSRSSAYTLGNENELAFSYAACGQRSPLDAYELRTGLRGKTLRARFLHNTGGWKGSYHPFNEGKNKSSVVVDLREDGWTGPTTRFVELVARGAGFDINITSLPEGIRDNSGVSSAWTQCAFATALGVFDLCVSSHFVTTEREEMTPMFTFENEQVNVYVDSSKKEFASHVKEGTIFSPFDPPLWFTILGIFILTSITFALQEASQTGSMLASETGGCLRRHGVATLESSYYTALSVCGATVELVPVTIGGRLVALGLGVLVLFSVLLYEAGMTAALVRPQIEIGISGFDEVLDRHLSICCNRQTARIIKAKHPLANFIDDPSDGVMGFVARKDVLALHDKGMCDVIIAPAEDMELEHGKGKHCSLHKVGPQIISLGKGLPLSPLHHRALAYHLRRGVNEGLWRQAKDEFRPSESACNERGGGGDDEVVTLQQVWPAYAVSGALVGTGALFTFVLHYVNKRRVRRGASELGRVVEHADVPGSLGDATYSCKHDRDARAMSHALSVSSVSYDAPYGRNGAFSTVSCGVTPAPCDGAGDAATVEASERSSRASCDGGRSAFFSAVRRRCESAEQGQGARLVSPEAAHEEQSRPRAGSSMGRTRMGMPPLATLDQQRRATAPSRQSVDHEQHLGAIAETSMSSLSAQQQNASL